MRFLVPLLLCAAFLRAEGTSGAASEPDLARLRAALASPARAVREDAAERIRLRARLDPSGVAALEAGLDPRARRTLVRAIAGAGTRNAAEVALKWASDADPEVFRALLTGLMEGREPALFAPLPKDVSQPRRKVIAALRLRWRLEAELARLKSTSGPTGHYTGQFDEVAALGGKVVPILFRIVENRAVPLPGEAAVGPYEAIDPAMAQFETEELRSMVAGGLGSVIDAKDLEAVSELRLLWTRYYSMDSETHRFEREDLAPNLAFSLFDLGDSHPADIYIADLQREIRQSTWFSVDEPLWELGYAYIRLHRYAEGETCYRQILDSANEGASKALAAYNLACAYAVHSTEDAKHAAAWRRQGIDYLTKAIRTYRFSDWPWMEADRDLDALRGEPEYKRLLGELKRKYPSRKRTPISKRGR